jgi:hypothetical protein
MRLRAALAAITMVAGLVNVGGAAGAVPLNGPPLGLPHFVLAEFGYNAGDWRVERHPDLAKRRHADCLQLWTFR